MQNQFCMGMSYMNDVWWDHVKFAAKELADHIKQMTGVELPVVPEWKGKGAVRLEKPPAERSAVLMN